MCGLVGMAGFLEHKHKCAMKDLLFLNSLRGKDSTGLSVISRDRKVLTRKMTVPGYEFIEYPTVDKAMCHADQLWIGHGRYKTIGEVSKANAHPFEVLDENGDVYLVGAHNGSLTNKYQLESELKGDKFDTDSETLFNWLVEAKDYKTAIGKLAGAWSLVWWDPTTNSVHFCRNAERPMCYAYTKDHKVLVWASEAWMIINACRRNGVELMQNDKGLSCYSTLTDHLYTLKIPQERNVELPELQREGGYVGRPAANFQGHWNNWKKNWWDDEEREKKAASGKKETGADSEKKETNVVSIGLPKDHVRGFGGELLHKRDFEAIRKKGCVWCGDSIEQSYGFLNEENMVCSKCLHDLHPKTGDCVRRDDDYNEDLDDDIPFDLTVRGEEVRTEDTPEYKRVIAAAAAKSVG